jgi:hypothetical protein
MYLELNKDARSKPRFLTIVLMGRKNYEVPIVRMDGILLLKARTAIDTTDYE